jgi:hypothetical protein
MDGKLLAFRFYLSELMRTTADLMHSKDLSGRTLYHKLANRLNRWVCDGNRHVCFITLNYDDMLDYALDAVTSSAVNSWDLASNVRDARFALLRPHGSANWVWPFVDERGQVEVTATLTEAYARSQLRLDSKGLPDQVRLELARPRWVTSGSFPVGVPALALPLRDNKDLVWPDEQRRHLESLRGRVTRVLSVGWRAAEPHLTSLLETLVEPRTRGLIVTGGGNAADDATQVSERLAAVVRRPHQVRFVQGFRSFLEHDEPLSRLLHDS